METTKRVVERKQPATMSVIVDGEVRHILIDITIVETFHSDGRKDCTIKVPRLQTKPQTKLGA